MSTNLHTEEFLLQTSRQYGRSPLDELIEVPQTHGLECFSVSQASAPETKPACYTYV